MKRSSTLFLKVVILLIGIGVLTGMILFPQIEGRNANADLVTIYLRDPLLAYTYIASIPFFVALYQAFRILGYIEQNKAFSQTSVRALRNIKQCAIAIIGFLIAGIAFVILGGEGDRAGAVAMGIFTTFASIIIATAAAIFESLLQNAVDIKSENDLTV
jgi:hypothetical protein